jgi:hypothetical protein
MMSIIFAAWPPAHHAEITASIAEPPFQRRWFHASRLESRLDEGPGSSPDRIAWARAAATGVDLSVCLTDVNGRIADHQARLRAAEGASYGHVVQRRPCSAPMIYFCTRFLRRAVLAVLP